MNAGCRLASRAHCFICEKFSKCRMRECIVNFEIQIRWKCTVAGVQCTRQPHFIGWEIGFLNCARTHRRAHTHTLECWTMMMIGSVLRSNWIAPTIMRKTFASCRHVYARAVRVRSNWYLLAAQPPPSPLMHARCTCNSCATTQTTLGRRTDCNAKQKHKKINFT